MKYLWKKLNSEYNEWLRVNNLEESYESLELFREDCYFRHLQENCFGLMKEIRRSVANYLSGDSRDVKCCWLSEKEIAELRINEVEEYDLTNKEKYVWLSDMDEEGVLIAFI